MAVGGSAKVVVGVDGGCPTIDRLRPRRMSEVILSLDSRLLKPTVSSSASDRCHQRRAGLITSVTPSGTSVSTLIVLAAGCIQADFSLSIDRNRSAVDAVCG